MEKEVVLIELNIDVMEQREKIMIALLLSILPCIAFIESYRYLANETYFWFATVVIFSLLMLNILFWNRFFLGISIVVQFILAGGIIAFHTLVSLIKGIEIVAGPQSRFQYGLFNFIDAAICLFILVQAVFLVTHLKFVCQQLKAQKKAKKNLKQTIVAT